MATLRQRKTAQSEKVDGSSVKRQNELPPNAAWNTRFSVDFVGFPVIVSATIYILILACVCLLCFQAYQRLTAHPDQTLLFRLITMFDSDQEKFKALRAIFGYLNVFLVCLLVPYFILLILNRHSHRLFDVTLSAPPTAPQATKVTPRIHLNRLLRAKNGLSMYQLMVKATLLCATVLEAVCSYYSTQHVLPARMVSRRHLLRSIKKPISCLFSLVLYFISFHSGFIAVNR